MFSFFHFAWFGAAISNVEGMYSVYFIKKTERHAAHTPCKRWRCAIESTLRSAFGGFDILRTLGHIFSVVRF